MTPIEYYPSPLPYAAPPMPTFLFRVTVRDPDGRLVHDYGVTGWTTAIRLAADVDGEIESTYPQPHNHMTFQRFG